MPAMLAEFAESLFTPCPWPARRLGYLGEAVALGARHRRLRRAWASHLERSRAFVREAASQADPSGAALVVGSGSLLDIPLDDLAARFDQVVLADMVHRWPVRLAARRFPGVRLVHADCTGCLTEVMAGRVPRPKRLTLFADLSPSFTVSANVLSQLPLLPAARLAHAGYEREVLKAFSRRMRVEHLEWLAGLPGVRCLVTDLESRMAGRSLDLLGGLDPGVPEALWTWDFAPRPEVRADADEVRQVAGYRL